MIYETNNLLLENQELKRKVFLKRLAEKNIIITTNENIRINVADSKSSFVQPITSEKILENPLEPCKQSSNDKIVKIYDSSNTIFQQVYSNDIESIESVKKNTNLKINPIDHNFLINQNKIEIKTNKQNSKTS